MIRKSANYDLSARNTFRMKVKCAMYVEYDSVKDLESLDWDSLPKPLMHIGGGSNLLFTGDFPGTVLHSAIKYIKYVDVGLDDIPVMVGAGVTFDDFVADTVGNSLWGAENLSLIPGEVGASAVQNIGAYGVEVKDIIKGVVCFDTVERKPVKFKVSECEYGYRDSMFKNPENKGRYIVTSVLFRVSRKPAPRLEYKGLEGVDASSPQAVRDAIISIRNSKLPSPSEIGSAGSFFKNPVVSAAKFASVVDIARRDGGEDVQVPHYILEGGFVKIPAAWLISSLGFRGAVQGGAAVYDKQPLVIINASGSAVPGDVTALERRITEAVKEHYDIELNAEVEHI